MHKLLVVLVEAVRCADFNPRSRICGVPIPPALVTEWIVSKLSSRSAKNLVYDLHGCSIDVVQDDSSSGSRLRVYVAVVLAANEGSKSRGGTGATGCHLECDRLLAHVIRRQCSCDWLAADVSYETGA